MHPVQVVAAVIFVLLTLVLFGGFWFLAGAFRDEDRERERTERERAGMSSTTYPEETP